MPVRGRLSDDEEGKAKLGKHLGGPDWQWNTQVAREVRLRAPSGFPAS
jgi:hypothetical protein